MCLTLIFLIYVINSTVFWRDPSVLNRILTDGGVMALSAPLNFAEGLFSARIGQHISQTVSRLKAFFINISQTQSIILFVLINYFVFFAL